MANEATIRLLRLDGTDRLLADYQREVIEGRTRERYGQIIQTGKKAGESLFSHVANGVYVLETLRPHLGLSEIEGRVLYTAFTIHDLNKVDDRQISFNGIATTERVSQEIEQLELGKFFPDWHSYLEDITSLIRGHGAHSSVAGETLLPKYESRYGLPSGRVLALTHLMRAADVIGLSHTLDEHKHKRDFLSHLNRYLTDSGSTVQFELHTHQMMEQRGLLTNLIHNVTAASMQDYGWLPILYYPDGIVYLAQRQHGNGTPDHAVLTARLGAAVAARLKAIVAGRPADLIEQTPQGIKFKPDAFGSGLSFAILFAEVRNIVARRRFKTDTLENNARKRIDTAYQQLTQTHPERAAALAAFVDSRSQLIQGSDEQIRAAELIRTYFILLNDHVPSIANPWQHIYSLIELPPELHAIYDEFDARYDRPYVLADAIALTEEDVYLRLIEDGTQLWEQTTQAGGAHEDERVWTAYMQRYTLIDQQPLADDTWPEHLTHYVQNQHHQCIHCSSPFPTQLLRAADVRDGIEVQKFSNRLLGGANREPVKSICSICRMQFLVESLNYESIHGEKLFYLHIFPRSFQTQVFVRAIERAYRHIRDEIIDFRALHLDLDQALQDVREDHPLLPDFIHMTKQGKPHTYGLYVPQYNETTAGLLVMPLNAPGDNDTEQYLFALWYALVLGRYFGGRVLLTKEPTPPLAAEHMPDLFLDMTPLASSGLLQHTAYSSKSNEGDRDTDSLSKLWDAVMHLFALRRVLSPAEDPTAELVRALTISPLQIFFSADRILESKKRENFPHEAHEHLVALAKAIGGDRMAQLSEALTQLAAHAWQHRLRGRSWERSSLLYPLKVIFEKLSQQRREHDREFIIALVCEDIFAHLERIQQGDHKIGRGKRDAIEQFVRGWFDLVVDGVYGGQTQRMLADEKALISAFLFYVHAQIPRKSLKTQDEKESE